MKSSSNFILLLDSSLNSFSLKCNLYTDEIEEHHLQQIELAAKEAFEQYRKENPSTDIGDYDVGTHLDDCKLEGFQYLKDILLTNYTIIFPSSDNLTHYVH